MKFTRDIKLHIELENEKEVGLLRRLICTGWNKIDYSQITDDEIRNQLNSMGYDLCKYLNRC